ncbi:MAG TPA: cytochrome d ubiquinol oxidase subunit II [Alphaproteobacteria bacterium]|nr:cytochrome d ubiquinol oxidase subunit II [Alphaproteobacteria bacterium]
MEIPLGYGLLRFIWWALLGIVLIGFAVMDGFDLGIAMLQPFVARGDAERRVLLNVIGPVWEGNQVWFVLGGGAAFAAWPPVYAVSFSGFYLAMFLVLAALILRPCAIAFRSKLEGRSWRRGWDWAFFVAGLVPSLVFGVAFGNLFLGVPFHFDDTLRITYEGGLLGLLNPFGLLAGLVSVAMLAMHGGTFLALKSEGEIAARAARAGGLAAVALIVFFTLAGLWISLGMDGYVVTSTIHPAAPSNPLAKTVVREAGAWLLNFGIHPWLILAPVIGYVGAIGAAGALRLGRPLLAFASSSLSIAGVIATAGMSLFPFLLASSSDPRSSLTVWDASSSQTTLFIMLVAVVIFLPIVLAYTAFVFRLLRGKVGVGEVEEDKEGMY